MRAIKDFSNYYVYACSILPVKVQYSVLNTFEKSDSST